MSSIKEGKALNKKKKIHFNLLTNMYIPSSFDFPQKVMESILTHDKCRRLWHAKKHFLICKSMSCPAVAQKVNETASCNY